MKILILADEVWNDYIFGNGVLTNWFTDFDAEFAEIYLSPGLPSNGICKRYYQVTDKQMLSSFFGSLAGNRVTEMAKTNSMVTMHQGIYKRMKKLSTYFHTPIMMLRDFIWLKGRYNTTEIKAFIDDFQPDVIFSPRMATPKFIRFERLIHRLTNKPIVAFTGDNEVGYDCYSFSPLFWLRRWYTTRYFRRSTPIYGHYFMHSQEQAEKYHNLYNLNTSTLFKCGNTISNNHIEDINSPLKIVYAGRLYCNRWKTLAQIGKALHNLNSSQVEATLSIYTGDELTQEQKNVLNEEYSIYVHSAVTPNELKAIYSSADIALHVESFDKKYKYATKYSFSTKIIDLLSSGCAVMAICWSKHAGYQYLHNQDAAICISSYDRIEDELQKVISNHSIIKQYANKALECVRKNHDRAIVHSVLRNVFEQNQSF